MVGRRAQRRVRLHLYDGKGQPGETVEGLQVGRRPIAGHYQLLMPKHIESPDHTNSLEGQLEVPAERVLFVQVLP